jgi:ABC-2 type transport system ATP-binding protein
MPAVEVNRIVKSYAERVVVDSLSFTVDRGEIFGLIGPNGAGKTTTIRMMMDIIKPDSGEIAILGERISEDSKRRLGYLPEERGLYKKLSVMDSIVYLSSLKGMDRRSAEQRANHLLEQTGMMAHSRKKIDELSKGMAQIIQFIVTIVHDPELVILDEAFSGLDPVNTELLKGLVLDLRDQGKVVVLSTHQMNQVEELCDRILMIDNGRAVLYGGLEETRAKYRGNSVIVDFEGELGEVPGVAARRAHKGYVELVLEQNATPAQVLERLVNSGISINRFEIATPSLNEIFLRVAGGNGE